ncbi:sensor histidine kinase [Gordonia rhizosphera]|uniref:Putative two-component histidine kinase n=1 Tax=Gordonia rhizosphera NBRC 16068 TaxID=1108045 RepID=K6WCZ7_9ACTN|nr:ATP-binding protein [Gordonia rhizosphera]GAB90067.1 putative two-component histidine kinase [Gordonia rhizosphera NBRC 16068]
MATLSPPATTPLTPTDEQSAAVRIERLFSIFVGAGYFAYLAILGPQIVAQSSATAAWWNLVAPLTVFIPPAVLLIAALARRRTLARYASRTCAVAFVVVALGWLPAWNGGTIHDQLWFSVIPGLAALAAAITLPRRATLTLMAAAIVTAQLANALCRPDDYAGNLTAEIMFAVAFILPYTGAALMAMRTGRLLDDTRAAAYAGAAAAAEADARRSQRSHVDGLLHDWVISTLLAAARQGNTDMVRRQARVTLEKLDSPPAEVTMLSADAVRTRLRAAVLAVDVSQQVVTTIDDDAASLRVPVDVVDVLESATGEALRNSIIHAGDDADRAVALHIAAEGIGVTVVDDGCGFDAASIPPHRLGLAVSILARVRSLPGGTADVVSGPGAGTRVDLWWENPR